MANTFSFRCGLKNVYIHQLALRSQHVFYSMSPVLIWPSLCVCGVKVLQLSVTNRESHWLQLCSVSLCMQLLPAAGSATCRWLHCYRPAAWKLRSVVIIFWLVVLKKQNNSLPLNALPRVTSGASRWVFMRNAFWNCSEGLILEFLTICSRALEFYL